VGVALVVVGVVVGVLLFSFKKDLEFTKKNQSVTTSINSFTLIFFFF
jgi:hypothetical protein